MIGAESADLVIRLATAAIGGLAVGIEREWSVKRGRHEPHFAGTRTFLLLALVGALGAELARYNLAIAGAALWWAAAALVVVAYAVTSRREDVGGTTEVAALIVLAGGVLAGLGRVTLASGLFAVTVLVLAEKSLIHRFVERIESHELMAGVRFAVLALVIFPLLPLGPFGPEPGFRPRELWALVLIFSGLSFVSFLALRVVGLNRGYGLVGLLGGLISSTAVTLNFSRESRSQPQLGRVLSAGVINACAVLPLRVVLLMAVLQPAIAMHAIPYLLAPCLAGLVTAALILRRHHPQATKAQMPKNPLRFVAAVQMAVVFQVVLYIMDWAGGRFGSSGTLASAAVAGLTDVDAVTYSMIKMGAGAAIAPLAAKALGVGVLSNTLFKGLLAITVGRGVFRQVTAAGLGAVAAASLAALIVLW